MLICRLILFMLITGGVCWTPALSLAVDQTDLLELGPGREFLPAGLTKAGVDEQTGSQLPLELIFRNDRNEMVRLQELFNGKNPVVLSLNYSNCPMLCVLQLNGLINSLREIDLVAGQDFQIVSISLDPAESVAQAALTKEKYIESYGKTVHAEGWHFLTGSAEAIQQVAETVGVRYLYLPEKKEYSHPAVFMVCMPDGRISRYHYGIEFPPQTIRLSLVEAGEGKIGSAFDRFLLLCFHYDENEGRYAPTARNIMKAGGVMIILALLGLFWVCHRRIRKQQAAAQTPSVVVG